MSLRRTGRRGERGAATVAALLVVALGYGSLVLSGAQVLRARIAPRHGLRMLAADVPVLAEDLCLDRGFVCYDEAYRAWSLASVVEVIPGSWAVESFGPWPAHDDFYAPEAADDGSITQWSEGYYITHNWSPYGKDILTLVPGDTVEVGGIAMRVEGIFDYPRTGLLGQIRSIVGEDAIVLQTCEPGDDDLNRIVYGPQVEK